MKIEVGLVLAYIWLYNRYFLTNQSAMKAIYIIILAITGINFSNTIDTTADPIQWSFEIEKISEGEYELVATADIKKDWVLYSQNNTDEGPVPTSFTFSKSSTNTLAQDVKEEGMLIKKHDELFDMVISKYKSKVVFRQLYKSTDSKANIAGYVTYMTCDGLRCLPPKDLDFNVSL